MKGFLYLLLATSAVFSSLCGVQEKMYLDENEMDLTCGTIRIHTGHNIWIETSTILKDARGIYTLESNLLQTKELHEMAYQRTWKCPYCHNHWPIGQKCQNNECPSKYM